MHRNEEIILIIFAVGVLGIGGYPPWDVECRTDLRLREIERFVRVEYAPLFSPPSRHKIIGEEKYLGGVSCQSSGINTPTIAATYCGWILLMAAAFVLVRPKKETT